MIFGVLNLEKIWHQQLVYLPTSPVYCSHFTLGNPKKVIFNSIISAYFRLFASSQKKTNCYPPYLKNVTALPWQSYLKNKKVGIFGDTVSLPIILFCAIITWPDWDVLCLFAYLGNRKVDFLLDVDGKPKIAIITQSSNDSAAGNVEMAANSANNTKRLTRHLVSAKHFLFIFKIVSIFWSTFHAQKFLHGVLYIA